MFQPFQMGVPNLYVPPLDALLTGLCLSCAGSSRAGYSTPGGISQSRVGESPPSTWWSQFLLCGPEYNRLFGWEHTFPACVQFFIHQYCFTSAGNVKNALLSHSGSIDKAIINFKKCWCSEVNGKWEWMFDSNCQSNMLLSIAKHITMKLN